MTNDVIDDKIFDFVFVAALRDAVSQKAYPYSSKPKMCDCTNAVKLVKEFANKVISGYFLQLSQEDYDNEFFALAIKVKNNISKFSFGNAQKLINITLKFLYIIGYKNDEYKYKFRYCHCPLDQIMLNTVWKQLGDRKSSNKEAILGLYNKYNKFLCGWGKEDFETYEEYCNSRYMIFQQAVRFLSKKDSISPLEYDYFYWE